MIKIILPFPVSNNSLYGGRGGRQRFPSKYLKAWWKACQPLSPINMDRVALFYKIYFPDNRERDTQNYIKCVTDYLVSQGVIVNDSWKNIIYEGLIPCGVDKNNPRCEIIVVKEDKFLLEWSCPFADVT